MNCPKKGKRTTLLQKNESMSKQKTTKIAVIYQVIMHYRIPFYERIALDSDYDFTLIYGSEKKGTKLINADISSTKIKSKKMPTIRFPISTGGSSNYLPFWPTLFFYLIRLAPDVVLSEGTSSLFNATIAFLYCKIFRKKFCWWSLGSISERKEHKGLRKFISRWELFIEENSDAIFTYSTQGKDYFLARGVKAEKIFVAVNVLDTNRKLAEIKKYNKAENHFQHNLFYNLVFIGSITKEKNLEILIDTLKLFNTNNGDIAKLHIIGDGPYINDIKRYVNDIGVCPSVVFHGRINTGASSILQNCDLMILPGLGGLAICEGMLNSLPIVTGNADGTEKDLVKNGVNGFILNPMNEQMLLEKVQYLYENPDIRYKMGKESYSRITSTYSFDNYYSVFKETIKSIFE